MPVSEDSNESFVNNVEDYVRNALGDLKSDYEDPDDMRNRLSELRDVVNEYSPYSWLESDFATAAQSIEETKEAAPEEDMSPTVATQVFANSNGQTSSGLPKDRKSREDHQIRELFKHLT
ncbi:hypothetical protein AS031_12610 [Pseudarthrobacter enclensis]|uniref:Uncharacterized protein n=1 Tax=Pseudarthrobacter enclensis TaxID=993070 RepID=A0A0V8ILI0_9MICC|nr:hypothetical protein AS031_12610 [Pseudarthrobacter enclensis]